ncbi:MAG: hypothetical protein KGQ48_00865 [Bradyrhizobium sp.]|nr:hypothetical protein [Bradyrhizobium sp.]
MPTDFLTASLSKFSKEDGEDALFLGNSGLTLFEAADRGFASSRNGRGA